MTAGPFDCLINFGSPFLAVAVTSRRSGASIPLSLGNAEVGHLSAGVHSVCAQMTQEFLDFTASRGNDLSSVVKAGQKWCLCVSR